MEENRPDDRPPQLLTQSAVAESRIEAHSGPDVPALTGPIGQGPHRPNPSENGNAKEEDEEDEEEELQQNMEEEEAAVTPQQGGTQPVEEPLLKPVMVEPVMEPVLEPVIVEPAMEPAMEPVMVEPAMEPVLEPVMVESALEPVMVEPAMEPVLEPVMVETAMEPVMEPLMEPGKVEDMEVTEAQQTENLDYFSVSDSDAERNGLARPDLKVMTTGHTDTHTRAELLPRVLLELRDSVCDTEESSSSSDSESESSSSSSSSSSSCATLATVLGQADDDDEDEGIGKKSAPIKTLDEVLPEELPAVEEVTVVLPEDAELRPVGTVSSIIQQLVIIQSLKGTPPLRDDSVLFNADRLAMGKVFEVFGPVCSPFYVLRFNSKDHVTEKGVSLNQTMFYTPTITDYTDYIFVEQLKQLRGSDASWKNDQEPPPEAVEFSDDDEERMEKSKNKMKTRKRAQRDDSNQPVQPNAGSHSNAPNPQRFSHQEHLPQRENWGPPPQHAGGNIYRDRHPHRHQHPYQHQHQYQHQYQYQPQYQHQYHQPPPPPPYHFPPPPCPSPPPTFSDYTAPPMGAPWPTQPYHTLPFSHLPPPPPPPPPQ